MMTRRQVLRSALGASLALPILPSLFQKDAFAKGPQRPPRLLWIASGHGGCWESNMFPSTSLLTTKQTVLPGHDVAAGALVASDQGSGKRGVSPVLSATQNQLSDALLGKMNVLRGVDIPFYIAHHTGGHLGNYARNDGNGSEGQYVQQFPRPTIDQLLGWSPSFYPDLSSIKERVMVMGNHRLSYNWSNPMAKQGTIDEIKGYDSSQALFKAIFVPAQGPMRAPIVDQVLASYKSLREGNRRLSSADRQRLDDHIARISELERKVNARANCGSVNTPTDEAQKHETKLTQDEAVAYVDLFLDVAVAAFICGTSRIANIFCSWSDEALGNYSGDWHQEVAHQWQDPKKEPLLVGAYNAIFSRVMLPLAAKLDAIGNGFGQTLLDDTLIAWTQECGVSTHDSYSIPIVTFGSAAGALKTGLYCDYRKVGAPMSKVDVPSSGATYFGLLYNQFLATVLNAMGMQPSDYELWGHKGYGVAYLSPNSSDPYVKHYSSTSSPYFTTASDSLPFLAA